jgi:hypothetical protein
MADFLRSTGPESFLGGTTAKRRGSLPTDPKSPTAHSVRSLPSTPVLRNRKAVAPPVPSPKFVAREPAGQDPEHSTLQLAAFLRTTGPNEAPVQPITLGSRKVVPKPKPSSIHSTGDSSTVGLLKYQSPQSSRFPPSPSTSTAFTTFVDDDDDDEDLELAMYPGARRKQKSAPQEESLADFLRNTAGPEPKLPPSPQTPKAVRDNFGSGLLKKMSRGNMRSPEPVMPKALDIFEVAKVSPPKMTSGDSHGGWQIGGTSRPPLTSEKSTSSQRLLSVNVPSSSMGYDEDLSRSNVSPRANGDEIRSIRKIPSRSLVSGAAPREAVQKRSATTDSLAEFLKNTGPTDFGSEPPPKTIKKSKSGFFKRLLGGGNERGGIQRSGSTSGRFTPITIPAEAR